MQPAGGEGLPSQLGVLGRIPGECRIRQKENETRQLPRPHETLEPSGLQAPSSQTYKEEAMRLLKQKERTKIRRNRGI